MLKLLVLFAFIGIHSAIAASYQINYVTVSSNDETYGPDQVREDLFKAIEYAEDQGRLPDDQVSETIAAIMNVANLLYQELPTKNMCRVLIGDIKAETDFDPNNISPGRDGSGDAYGLMQVSPEGDSQELQFFKDNVDSSLFLDWNTGMPIDLNALVKEDLFRPWINIHVASFFQSNLGRTGSSDPSNWAPRQDADGGQERSVKTSLGSWVAGPADSDETGYNREGDDISAEYFSNILEIVSQLEGYEVGDDYLSSLQLHPGVVGFKGGW